MRYSFILLGALFGFLLSRAGATTYDYYATLFLFTNLQLMWVIAAAAGVGAVGIQVVKRTRARALIGGAELSLTGKPWTRGLVGGSLLFGVGWGLAGACPGTALAMLGEGKMGSAFTIVGILIGTWLYGVQRNRAEISASPAGDGAGARG